MADLQVHILRSHQDLCPVRVDFGVDAFLHQLWITLAILASCGMSGLVHWSPIWALDGAAGHSQRTLVETAGLRGRTTIATRLHGAAKTPSDETHTATRNQIPGHDGDGSGSDPLWYASAFETAPWLYRTESKVRKPHRGGERILKGMEPKEGGKRGPPVFWP